jgi:hypothetical protein
LVLFPYANLSTAKTCPALVVQTTDLNTGFLQFIVAMITSKMFRVNHASRVPVFISEKQGLPSGLLSDLVVMTHNLATIFESEISQLIGQIPMSNVDTALRHTLGLKKKWGCSSSGYPPIY